MLSLARSRLLLPLTLLATLIHGVPIYPRAAGPALAIGADFPDPAILQVGDTWYAYSTSNIGFAGGPGHHVQMATSKDFITWQRNGGPDVFPKPGAWVYDPEPQIWAPDVVQIAPDKFVLYYAARPQLGTTVHCIGAAVSNSPAGPFIALDKPFTCPISDGGAIDPDLFFDSDGKLYVTYKIDGSAIGPGGPCGNGDPLRRKPTPLVLQEISAADGVTPIGAGTVMIDHDPAGGDGALIEAPSLAKDGDTYFLFFSSSCYNELGYDVSFATAPSIRGPWTKAHSPEQQAPLLLTGMYLNLPPGGLVAPGGMDVKGIGGGRFNVAFHGSNQRQSLPGTRFMYTAVIRADGNKITVE